ANESAHGFARECARGTVGYGVLVLGFTFLLQALDAAHGAEVAQGAPCEPALAAMFPVTAAVMLVAGAIALALPRSSALEVRAARGDWRRLLAHPPYVRLLVAAFLGYVALQGPMGLFPIFLPAHGRSLDPL